MPELVKVGGTEFITQARQKRIDATNSSFSAGWLNHPSSLVAANHFIVRKFLFWGRASRLKAWALLISDLFWIWISPFACASTTTQIECTLESLEGEEYTPTKRQIRSNFNPVSSASSRSTVLGSDSSHFTMPPGIAHCSVSRRRTRTIRLSAQTGTIFTPARGWRKTKPSKGCASERRESWENTAGKELIEPLKYPSQNRAAVVRVTQQRTSTFAPVSIKAYLGESKTAVNGSEQDTLISWHNI